MMFERFRGRGIVERTSDSWSDTSGAFTRETKSPLTKQVTHVRVHTFSTNVDLRTNATDKRHQTVGALTSVPADSVPEGQRKLSLVSPISVDTPQWILHIEADSEQFNKVPHGSKIDTISPQTDREGHAVERSVFVDLDNSRVRDFAVNTEAGDVHTESLRGSLNVQTTQGDVQIIDHGAGPAIVHTESGGIIVKDFERDRSGWWGGLEVTTEAGDVHVDKLFGRLKIDTQSGDVRVTDATIFNDDEIAVKTETGDITVIFTNKDARVTATTAGEISIPEGFRVLEDRVRQEVKDGRPTGPFYRTVEGDFGKSHVNGDVIALKSELGAIVFQRTETQKDSPTSQ